jgi:hypothetical protein
MVRDGNAGLVPHKKSSPVKHRTNKTQHTPPSLSMQTAFDSTHCPKVIKTLSSLGMEGNLFNMRKDG